MVTYSSTTNPFAGPSPTSQSPEKKEKSAPAIVPAQQYSTGQQYVRLPSGQWVTAPEGYEASSGPVAYREEKTITTPSGEKEVAAVATKEGGVAMYEKRDGQYVMYGGGKMELPKGAANIKYGIGSEGMTASYEMPGEAKKESYKILGTTKLGAVMVQPEKGGAIIYENPQYFKEHYKLVETKPSVDTSKLDVSNIIARQGTAYIPSQQARNVPFPESYITPSTRWQQGLRASRLAESPVGKLSFLVSQQKMGGILPALEYGAAVATNQTAALERAWTAERYDRAMASITNPVTFATGELQGAAVQGALMLTPWGKLPPALRIISTTVGGLVGAKLASEAVAEPTPEKIGKALVIPATIAGTYVLGKLFPSTGKPIEVKVESKSDVYPKTDLKVGEPFPVTAKTKLTFDDAKTIITGEIPVERPGVVIKQMEKVGEGGYSKYMVGGQPSIRIEQQVGWMQRILGAGKVARVTESVEELIGTSGVKKIGTAGAGEFNIDKFVTAAQAGGSKVVTTGLSEEVIKSEAAAITDFGTSVSQSVAKIYGKLVGKTGGGQVITGDVTGTGTAWDISRAAEGGGGGVVLISEGGGIGQLASTESQVASQAVQSALTGKLVGIAGTISKPSITTSLVTGAATAAVLAAATAKTKPTVPITRVLPPQGIITGLPTAVVSRPVVVSVSPERKSYLDRLVGEGYLAQKPGVVVTTQAVTEQPPHPYGEPTPIPSSYDVQKAVTGTTPHIIRAPSQAFTSLVGTIYPKSDAKVRRLPAEISESAARETNVQELLTGEEAELSKKGAVGLEVGIGMTTQPATRQQPRVQPITSLETGEVQQQKMRQLLGQTLEKEYAQKRVVNPFATAVNVMTGTQTIPVPVYNLSRDIGRVSGKPSEDGGWTFFVRHRPVATAKQVIQLLGGSQRKNKVDFRKFLNGSRSTKAVPKGKQQKKKDWRDLF